MDKNTKMCIGAIILIVVVVLVVQNKDKLVRKNNVVESFNSPESSNNISLDDIQKKLDEL